MNDKKFAFTLAEVLITLGIIGVVAALTLPSFVAKYQKKVFITQLKKDVSWIQNSIKRIIADEGVDNIYDSSIGITLPDDTGAQKAAIDSEKFGEYFKLEPYKEMTVDESDVNSVKKFMNSFYLLSMMIGGKSYMLKDGSCVNYFSKRNGSDSSTVGNGDYLIVDVNCDKQPNKGGYDRFMIDLDSRGNILSLGMGASAAGLEEIRQICSSYYQKQYSGNPESYYVSLIITMRYCTPLVIYDGWEINY